MVSIPVSLLELPHDLRDCHGRIGVVVSAVNTHSFAIWLVNIVVLDVATCCLDPVFGDICEAVECRVASWAMIALIVVVRQRFPVVFAYHLPLMIEAVFVHVEMLQSWLEIDGREILLPRDFWCVFGV